MSKLHAIIRSQFSRRNRKSDCIRAAILAAGVLLLAACASVPSRSLPTVSHVDLERYMGKWHEVARLPFVFQRGTTGATANYQLSPDGTVSVVNRAYKGGKPVQVQGKAKVVDPQTRAILEVRFNEWFSIFVPRAPKGNYFVVWLASDYSAAAVGTPDRGNLWILARTRSLPPVTFRKIVTHCQRLGFPVEALILSEAQKDRIR